MKPYKDLQPIHSYLQKKVIHFIMQKKYPDKSDKMKVILNFSWIIDKSFLFLFLLENILW